MTTQQLAEMVSSFGYPFAYDHFDPTPQNPMPAPPFICFFLPNSEDFYADNRNYQPISEVHFELYTANKDFGAEAVIEGILGAQGFAWYKEETYLGGEKLYMVTWECSAVV